MSDLNKTGRASGDSATGDDQRRTALHGASFELHVSVSWFSENNSILIFTTQFKHNIYTYFLADSLLP